MFRAGGLGATALLAGAVTVACGDGVTDIRVRPAFAIDYHGERFVVEVETAAQVEELEARRASGESGVIDGVLVAGDGGFNGPWSWHLEPGSVHPREGAMEICDGLPTFVEDELPYWLGTVKRYCPWGARVVGRLR